MRTTALIVLAVALFIAVPAALGQSEGRHPETMTIWQPGGIAPDVADLVTATADAHRARWTVVRSGTIQMTEVARGEEIVQAFRPGYRVPMATLAVDPVRAESIIGAEAAAALIEGTIVFGESSAALRGAQVGDVIRFFDWNGVEREVAIGAIVPDAQVSTSELVFSHAMADEFGFDRLSSVWVWAVRHQDAFLIDLLQTLPDQPMRVRSWNDPPDPDSVQPVIRIKERFGEFSYVPRAGDAITIDPDWVAANIETRTIPIFGTFRCHREMWPKLEAVVERIEQAQLDGLIRRSDFRSRGGCYNAREIRGGDKGGAISRHSWGVAIDINPSSNPYGGPIRMNPAIVDIFHELGFAWGGGWTFVDGAHFEWKFDPGDSP